MSASHDVLIIGGGPVGTALAALLARAASSGTPWRVALLEAAAPPADGRVVALSRASERILGAAGAWSAIRPHAWPYEHMRVWHHSVAAESDAVLKFDAAQVGEPNLGYIIETRCVTMALTDAFLAAGGELIHGELQSLDLCAGDPAVRVRTTAGELAARLIVGADGAQSRVRAAFGIEARTASYEQMALVARVRPQASHRNTAWQRFVEGGTLALLPLADGNVSIVWSVRAAQAQALLAASAGDFEAQLLDSSDAVLGRLTLEGARQAFPLKRLSATRYTASRCALVGDAAHVVHPLAGLGVNLGLLDAAALAQLSVQARAAGEAPEAQRTLRAYERWRKGENQLMELAIDAFNRVLAQGAGPLAVLAQRALALTNRSELLKRFFIGRALGQAPSLTAWESDPAWLHR